MIYGLNFNWLYYYMKLIIMVVIIIVSDSSLRLQHHHHRNGQVEKRMQVSLATDTSLRTRAPFFAWLGFFYNRARARQAPYGPSALHQQRHSTRVGPSGCIDPAGPPGIPPQPGRLARLCRAHRVTERPGLHPRGARRER